MLFLLNGNFIQVKWFISVFARLSEAQKQFSIGDFIKKCFENMQQIYRHDCSPVNLQQFFRAAFYKNTCGGLLPEAVFQDFSTWKDESKIQSKYNKNSTKDRFMQKEIKFIYKKIGTTHFCEKQIFVPAELLYINIYYISIVMWSAGWNKSEFCKIQMTSKVTNLYFSPLQNFALLSHASPRSQEGKIRSTKFLLMSYNEQKHSSRGVPRRICSENM